MKKMLKKIGILLFMLGAFLVFGKQTYAETLDMETILENLPEMEDPYQDPITVEIGANKTLNIKCGENLTFDGIIKYRDTDISNSYIEYDIRHLDDYDIRYDLSDYLIQTIVLDTILQTAFNLADVEDSLTDIKDYIDTYEKYGFLRESQVFRAAPHTCNPEDEHDCDNDREVGDPYRIIKYFKLSLDTDKIQELGKVYGGIGDILDDNKSDNEDKDTNTDKSENTDGKKEEETAKEDPKNPKTSTGMLFPLFGSFVCAVAGMIVLLFTKTKKYF